VSVPPRVVRRRDPVARRAAVEELYDLAVRFADPEGEGVGHDAIDAASPVGGHTEPPAIIGQTVSASGCRKV
jgi:hypothetical protein